MYYDVLELDYRIIGLDDCGAMGFMQDIQVLALASTLIAYEVFRIYRFLEAK